MEFTAFYLPQFHPIPENDEMYGKGFTEWDNVRKARPLFQGHVQPHVPHPKIGYYSLLDRDFLEFQHGLAYAYGVRSFCYYYYNFAGKTLLERPLRYILHSPRIRNHFCLCWVHTSWYDNRKAPDTPFIAQQYSPENAILLCHGLMPYWRDPRYITVDGRPLLLIWAPERHPMIEEYAMVLRHTAQKHGFPNPYLAGVEAYAAAPPWLFGLDAMVEFAPDWRRENHVSPEGEKPVRIDYQKTVEFMLNKARPAYTRFRCAFPGWDNTPRRGRDGIACVHTQASLFESWLKELSVYTKKELHPQEQRIFINAWNEWGEGCYLEPDEEKGFTYLEISRRVASEWMK